MSQNSSSNEDFGKIRLHASHDFLMDAPIGIFISTPKGKYLSANSTLARMYGYETPEELIKSILDIAAQVYADPADRKEFMRLMEEHGEVVNLESRRLRSDGTTFWISMYARAVLDEQGTILHYQGFTTDITERKQAGEKMRKRLAHEKLLTRISTLAVTAGDPSNFLDQCIIAMGETTAVSRIYIFKHCHETDTMDNTHEWCATGIVPQKEQLQGISSDHVRWWVETLKNGQNICFTDIENIPDEGAKGLLRPQGIYSILVVPLFVEGRYHGFLGFDECLQPRTWKQEDVIFLLSVSRIIAVVIERWREAERVALERSQLLSIFNSIDEPIYVSDPHTYEILFANQALKKVFQKSPVGGICHREFQGLDSPCPFCTNEILLKQSPDGYGWEFFNPARGRTFSAQDRIIQWPDGRNVRFQMAIDITERKQAEEAVLASEKRYRAIVENQMDLVCRYLPGGVLTYVNPAYCRVFGKNRDELVGNSFLDLIPTELHASIFSFWRRFSPESPRHGMEHEITTPEGDKLWISWYDKALYDEKGRIEEFQCVGRDITKKKLLEEEIKRSRDLVFTLIDGIIDPLIMLDAESRVVLANKAAAKRLGQEHFQTIIGLSSDAVLKRILPDAEQRKRIQDLIATGRDDRLEVQSSMEPFRIELFRTYPVPQNNKAMGNLILCVADVTHVRLAREQLVRQDKLASLGVMVSSIAHEINNPNNLIIFNLPILREYVQELMPILKRHATQEPFFSPFDMSWKEFQMDFFKILDTMEHGSQRINRIVAGLKYFLSGKGLGIHSLEVIQPEKVIRQILELCSYWLHKHRVSWVLDIGSTPERMRTAPGVLEQVLINLLTNAAQAMDKPEPRIRLRAFRGEHPKTRLMLEVEDNGQGMDSATQKRIFEPFFSTKEAGNGLGLYISRNLLEYLGGWIEVESRPGQGSIFRVMLPDARMDKGEEASPQTSSRSNPGQGMEEACRPFS